MGVGAFAVAFEDLAALAGAGPVGQTRLGLVRHAVAGAFAGGGVAIDVVGPGVHRRHGILADPVAEGHFTVRGGVGNRNRGLGAVALGLVALQQGIALQLGLDELLELDVRQLQQLDRLLQLGRDDQPLPLSDL